MTGRAPVPVLAGTRVLVTAQRRAEDLSRALRRRGASVTVAPALGMRSGVDEDTLLARTRRLVADGADVVVVTTGIGFRAWLDTADAAGLGADLLAVLARTRLVARGPKAHGALLAAGLTPAWVAGSESSAQIGDVLVAEGVQGATVVIQHHGGDDVALQRRLADAGARTVDLVVYRWGPPPDAQVLARSVADAAAGRFDAALFTSAPGAAAWLAAAAAAGVLEDLRAVARDRLLLAAVGPVTAVPLRDAGFTPVVPDRARLGALARCVVHVLGDGTPGVATAAGTLRVRACAATVDHAVVPVPPGGLGVLRALAADPGAVRSREDLLAALPGGSGDPHSVEVAVARLREAVGRPIVQTVVKRGYRLALPSAPMTASPGTP